MGGVQVPCEFKAVAHSDGDVLLHALAEAVMGGLAIGDLGTFFPDTSEKTKGMDSSLILEFALNEAEKKGYKLGNADISLIAEAPKLSPFILPIRKKLAELCKTDISCISVKAGTNEGLDAIGQKKAIGCFASVLLVSA